MTSSKLFKAIVIVGATASGKSALAHWLFDSLQSVCNVSSRLVNLDAFQIYKHFDIGTAKPTLAEREKYHYEMLDLVEPYDGLDAREFAKLATDSCQSAYQAGHIPICVGGSGLYLRAFLHGLDDFPVRSDLLRNFIRDFAKKWGWPALHAWLAKLDAVRATELHPNDKTRIERALEIIWLSGKKVSDSRSQTDMLKNQNVRFESFVIQVDGTDDFIKLRVEKRTAELFEIGWINEVAALQDKYGLKLSGFPAARAIGYHEILSYLNSGEQQSVQASAVLQSDVLTKTWQYARRQRTWNAKEKCDATFSWQNDNQDELFAAVRRFLTL